MSFLELRTLLFGYVITSLVNTIVMIFLWRQNRMRFKGTFLLVADFFLVSAGTVFIVLRGHIPDLLSMPISNTMIVGGAVLGYMGLRSFAGIKAPNIQNLFLLPVFFAVHYYYTFLDYNLEIRSLNISIGLLVVFIQCAWMMFFGVEKNMRRLTAGVGTVFILFSLINIARIFEFFFSVHNAKDYFHSGAFNSLVLLVYQILFVLLIYSLALMFNKRLLSEIILQEEKFSKAFHSSAYAITLTRLSDGKIVEVNEGFCRITGFRSDEVIGKTTGELHLWERDEEREEVVEELTRSGRINGSEHRFRNRSGEIITGMLYAETMTINNEKFLVSGINDISSRKRDENRIRALLKEKEIILKEVHHRIKNNMNTVYGLLVIQAEDQDNTIVRERLLDAAGRVQSMGFLYDRLYRSEPGSSLSLGEYLPSLLNEIAGIYSRKCKVNIINEVEDISIEPDLLPSLGIIINELVTNSMKYAFENSAENNITVKAFKSGERVSIVYEDNGRGLPESFSSEKSSGFGFKLIEMLTEQIGGTINVENGKGARFIISFNA